MRSEAVGHHRLPGDNRPLSFGERSRKAYRSPAVRTWRVRGRSPPASGAGSGGTFAMPPRRALDHGAARDHRLRGESFVEPRVPRRYRLWLAHGRVAARAVVHSCSTPRSRSSIGGHSNPDPGAACPPPETCYALEPSCCSLLVLGIVCGVTLASRGGAARSALAGGATTPNRPVYEEW